MATETLRPNAAGDEENIRSATGNGVGDHHELVDEAVSDEYTTNIAETDDYHRDFYNIAASGVGAGIINHITVYVNTAAGGTPLVASVKVVIKAGTGAGAPDTPAESAEKTLTEYNVWTEFSNQWADNPATSSAWTWDEIDKLQIGVSLKECRDAGHTTHCTQVWVVVDYTSPPTPQAVGGGAMAIAGTLGRNIFVTRGQGAIAIAGSLNRKTSKAIGAGSIAIAGTLGLKIKLVVGAGAVGIAGILVRLPKIGVGSGAIAIAGTLGRLTKVTAGDGAIAIAGTLGILTKRVVGGGAVGIAGTLTSVLTHFANVGSGAVGMAGSLNRKIYKAVGEGAITFAGAIEVLIRRAVGGGAVGITGAVNILTKRGVGAGAISIAGALGRKIFKAIGGGTVTSAGALEADYTLGVQVGELAVTILKGSLRVEQRIEERSIAEFTVVDLFGVLSFSKGQLVKIYDPNNVLIFGGVVDNPETIRTAPSGELLHPITCADYHYFADKRLVAEAYAKDDERTCGYIVDDIFDKYLAEEGITIGNIELGPILVEAVFNYVRVTDAYDALAEKAGKIWYIDEEKKLYFQDRELVPADWTITGDYIIKGSGRLSGANPQYRNRQYIRGGRATTDPQVETFQGDADTVAFTVGYPIVKVPSVTVDGGAPLSMGIKGLDTTKECYWSKGDPTILLAAVPGAVDVVVTYEGEYPILALVEDTDEIATQLATEGVGTGYVEDIADEPTLNETQALLDSGLAKLARFGVIGQSFTFQTRRTGLKPGQLAPVLYPALGLDCDMLIESVVTRVYTGNLMYNVTAIIGPESGSWANLFKALALMKQEVIERLNVGTQQLLIILVSKAEVWGWEEDYEVLPYVCPFPSATTYPLATLYPC